MHCNFFFFSELLKSVVNLINKDTTVYILNNTLMGLDVTGKLDFNNNFNDFANNLWYKGKVDIKGFFTLTSLTAKKNLRATSKTDFDLIEQGMLLVMMYNLCLKVMFFPFFIFTDHDFSFHFWSPNATKPQNVPLSDLFRSDYSYDTPKRPQSTLYTLISLKTTL